MPGTTRKLVYAIEAVLDIAYNSGGAPVQSGQISERQGIPARYLEPVLQQLVREGVLKGVRGPRGGYKLARERRRITLGDITRVVRSLETSEDALAEETGSTLGNAVIRPLLRGLHDDWMARLDTITIDELCAEAHKTGQPSDAMRRLDFSI
ncbi:MAG: Rrf2 family transcriptional regulator [Pseudomonadota bacterium]